MMREIEAKYRVADPDALRRRLSAYGARQHARMFETNRLFDTTERELLAADCGLRLRTCRPLDDAQPPAATLTYKGPRDPGELKAREEVEASVGDADAVAAILQRLGFREVIVYEKHREAWRLGECEVCLDELPKLGWFVEIEGPGAKAIDPVLVELGLSRRTPSRDTYVELAARQGTQGADGIGRLVF
jgi:adenylate cyclase class 2